MSAVIFVLVAASRALLAAPAGPPATTPTAPSAGAPGDVTELSLEDLMSLEVTSVSRKGQRLADTAAAVFVITAEDIRRSGVSTVAEALRLAPGVHVARIDSGKWAIGVRGFNGRYADKLLVLIDGRSLYSPSFGGVYWDTLDTFLGDVARIEVVSGPGATAWGANAVNGVINIITRPAGESRGSFLRAAAGSSDLATLGGRYGFTAGARGALRVWGKLLARDDMARLDGGSAEDSWQGGRAGFRGDWSWSGRDTLMLQGQAYRQRLGDIHGEFESFDPPGLVTRERRYRASGVDLLGRFERALSSRSALSLQMYVDRTHRNEILSLRRDTFDVELQHRLGLGQSHDLQWGVGYRVSGDRVGRSLFVQLEPQRLTATLLSAFVQDEVRLAGERVRLKLGARLEHHSDVGAELEPSVSVLWAPKPHTTLWASYARAVKTPSRLFTDLRVNILSMVLPDAGLTVFGAAGNPDLASEDTHSLQAGLRHEPTTWLFVDLSAFHSTYHRLQGQIAGAPVFDPDPVPHLFIGNFADNRVAGSTRGGSAAITLNPSSRLSIDGSASLLFASLNADGPVLNLAEVEGLFPELLLQLGSHLGVGRGVELNARLFHTGRVAGRRVPAHTRLDVSASLRLDPGCELSLGVHNALDDRQLEWDAAPDLITTTEIRRNWYGSLAWRF